MLYTTYFGNLRQLPSSVAFVSIAGKAPEWFNGPEWYQYKKLAPKWSFFQEWKINGDNSFYTKCFNEQVLSNLNANQVFQELKQMTGCKDIALICYERPEEFCHRHLVANWFRENGIPIKEWNSY